MTINILLPVVSAVVGLLLWVLAAQQKVSEAGRILFACGVFISLLLFAQAQLRIG